MDFDNNRFERRENDVADNNNASTATILFLNYLKVEVERLARWLVERGYENIPAVRDLLPGIESILGSHTGTALDMLAAVINNPESVKKWLQTKFGTQVGDKLSDIIDEFIDEFFEKLRDLWRTHGANIPPAELEKLSRSRASQSILPFSDALNQLEPVKRRRLKSLLASLETTGDPSERTRFAFYRSRFNNPRALAALLDAADYTPDLLTQRLDTDPKYAAIRLDQVRFAALKERALKDLQTGAKQRMFQDLETVYGEYKPSFVKRAGAFIAEKAKIVYGDPVTEIPQLTQKLETKVQEMSNLRAQIRARRMARR